MGAPLPSLRSRSLMLVPAALAISTALQQQPPLRQISSTPTCRTCSITLERQLTFQLPSESLSFGLEKEFTRLADGRFIVFGLNETKVPALLDRSGRFVRLIARMGQGPGEIQYPDLVTVGVGDSVLVSDGDIIHFFTPDLRFVRDMRLQHTAVDMLVGDDGGMVIMSEIAAPARRRYPLHLVDRSGTVTRSFGLSPSVTEQQRLQGRGDNLENQLRFLTRGAQGTVWAYNPLQFLLEQYDFKGRLLAQGRHALDGWYKVASEAQPGRGEFTGKTVQIVQSSQEPSVLWLVYAVRNASYTPQTAANRSPPREGVHDVVVEALDTRTLQVLAMQRFAGISAAKINNAPDFLAIYQKVDDVFGTYHVSKLRLLR